jgi:hypothetical protein
VLKLQISFFQGIFGLWHEIELFTENPNERMKNLLNKDLALFLDVPVHLDALKKEQDLKITSL